MLSRDSRRKTRSVFSGWSRMTRQLRSARTHEAGRVIFQALIKVRLFDRKVRNSRAFMGSAPIPAMKPMIDDDVVVHKKRTYQGGDTFGEKEECACHRQEQQDAIGGSHSTTRGSVGSTECQ
jgi:hypothetical protein